MSVVQRIDATEERFRTLKTTISKPPNGTGVYLLHVRKAIIKAKTRRYPGPGHSETGNEAPQGTADINAGKAENTKDDYRTLKEQSGRDRKAWKFFRVSTGGGLVQRSTDPVSNRREIRLDSFITIDRDHSDSNHSFTVSSQTMSTNQHL